MPKRYVQIYFFNDTTNSYSRKTYTFLNAENETFNNGAIIEVKSISDDYQYAVVKTTFEDKSNIQEDKNRKPLVYKPLSKIDKSKFDKLVKAKKSLIIPQFRKQTKSKQSDRKTNLKKSTKARRKPFSAIKVGRISK